MKFISPLLLFGLAAAAVPLIIHLIGRRRAPRRAFAAIDFVLRSNRKVARRLRMRHILLLAVRMLLAAIVAIMMARPFTEVESELPAVGARLQSAVIVMDDTLSMRRRYQGRQLFDHARDKARELVQLMGVQADVAVLGMTRPSGPLPALTRKGRRVQAAISSMKVGFEHATLSPALVWAVRILSESSHPQRHIFVISDMAAHGSFERRADLPAGVQLHMVEIGGEQAANHAVVRLTTTPSVMSGQRMMRIVARICNHGAGKTRKEVTLAIDGKEVTRGLVEIGPWTCADKPFQHAFAKGGMHNAVVAMAGDDLPEDDRRFLRLEVESHLSVLLINGDPSPVRHRDELFYLETALHGKGPRGRPINTRSVTAGELGRVQLRSFDVVVLCNVSKLPPRQVTRLRAFVRKGGGMLAAVGDNIEPGPFNASFGDLLPVKLRGAVSSASPGSGAPALRIGRADSTHPMISPVWSERHGGGVRSARFHRVFHLQPSTRADHRVILWYEAGVPALLEARLGEGRTLLFTSTLDRDWNDLPIRPGYLPLVQQMIRYLSRAGITSPRQPVLVGDTEKLPVPGAVSQLRLSRPSGVDHTWTKEELAGQPSVNISADLPGFYKLSAVGSDGVIQPLERESFVANVSPKESDLRRHIKKSGQHRGRSHVARAKRRVELWHGLGIFLLALVLFESFMVRRG